MADLPESAADIPFDEWVVKNGGSPSFISLLAEFGFTSRLSLQHLKEEEATELFDRMNCGQRSLLRGLISLSSTKIIESEHSGYGKCLEKISTCKQASGGVQTKLSQLFNLQKPKQADGESSSSSFQPQPLVSRKIRKRTSASTPTPKYQKLKKKCKVKEVKVKVVGMEYERSSTPVGAERESMMKSIWIRESANEDEVHWKICEAFDWDPSEEIRFMYSSGRHLRAASLRDIENSDSWDCETVKALMGNGCLYVAKADEKISSDSENEVSSCIELTKSQTKRLIAKRIIAHLVIISVVISK